METEAKCRNCGSSISEAQNLKTQGYCPKCNLYFALKHDKVDPHSQSKWPPCVITNHGELDLNINLMKRGHEILNEFISYSGNTHNGLSICFCPEDSLENCIELEIKKFEQRIDHLQTYWLSILQKKAYQLRILLWKWGYRKMSIQPIISKLSLRSITVDSNGESSLNFYPFPEVEGHGLQMEISKNDKVTALYFEG